MLVLEDIRPGTPGSIEPGGFRLDAPAQAYLRRPASRRMRAFHDYWQAKRPGAGLPARADLDPVDIPELLPNVFLVDLVPGLAPGAPPRFRFRLVGTQIAEREGEMTGRFLDALAPGGDQARMRAQYDRAVAGQGAVRHETLRWDGRAPVRCDVLLLPLAGDGRRVDMLFGFCCYHQG